MSRIALVTGAASGIGLALSRALASHGNTVVLADLDETGAVDAAASINSLGHGLAIPRALDVRDADQCAAVVSDVHLTYGRLDLMVNNAGVGIGGPVEELSLDHWNHVIDINLRGVINGVRAVYPLMIQQGHGHILNTASLAGLVPAPYLTPYATTKHAVVGLSLSLRAEAALHGVNVSVLCPGVIDTPILDSRNPSHLPTTPDRGTSRELLVKSAGKPYDPDLLALDVLRGLAANRAIIVAPRNARFVWRLFRLSPALVMRRSGDIIRGLAGRTTEST